MEVELFYIKINDLELKTLEYKEILEFVKMHKKGANGICKGSLKVPAERVQHCIDNVSVLELHKYDKERQGIPENELYWEKRRK